MLQEAMLRLYNTAIKPIQYRPTNTSMLIATLSSWEIKIKEKGSRSIEEGIIVLITCRLCKSASY